MSGSGSADLREVVVLARAGALLPERSLTDTSADGRCGLTVELLSRGWEAAAEGSAGLLVDADGDRAAAAAATVRPLVIAVRCVDQSWSWPGWQQAVLDAGYAACQFTGRWRLYVSEDRTGDIGPALAVPATDRELLDEGLAPAEELTREIVRWRNAAVGRWAEAAHGATVPSAGSNTEIQLLRREIEATHATVSWRITAPLRAIQRRRLHGR